MERLSQKEKNQLIVIRNILILLVTIISLYMISDISNNYYSFKMGDNSLRHLFFPFSILLEKSNVIYTVVGTIYIVGLLSILAFLIYTIIKQIYIKGFRFAYFLINVILFIPIMSIGNKLSIVGITNSIEELNILKLLNNFKIGIMVNLVLWLIYLFICKKDIKFEIQKKYIALLFWLVVTIIIFLIYVFSK